MPLIGNGVDSDSIIAGLNGDDFLEAMSQSGILKNVAENIIRKFPKFSQKWFSIIESSFLSQSLQDVYKLMIEERLKSLLNFHK